MNSSDAFRDFLANLIVQNKEEISGRYKTSTKALNKKFYGKESDIANSLQIGSYGRKTAVNGVSDLDMIFELSDEDYKKYNSANSNGQLTLLQDVKKAIETTYSTSEIKADRYVVVVNFTNYVVEVCPVFLQTDKTYKFPDSYNDGRWKNTNPRPEINEVNSFDVTTNNNLKSLAKMTRAWKNRCGVKMGGLLVDTLCFEFLQNHEEHWEANYSTYDILIRDYFEFLKDYNKERKEWYAPGSNQKVYKKGSNFIAKAKKSHANIIEAISKKDNDTVYSIWRKVFGYQFPYPKTIKEASINYTQGEEYIEDRFPIDILYALLINCRVKQNGFQIALLKEMLEKLRKNKKLEFFIQNTDVQKPYQVFWKIKNEGQIAKDKNMLRGQIVKDNGREIRNEDTNFEGAHFVECYIIKNNVCVARDRVDVPIANLI
jgi:hypothetical protein